MPGGGGLRRIAVGRRLPCQASVSSPRGVENAATDNPGNILHPGPGLHPASLRSRSWRAVLSDASRCLMLTRRGTVALRSEMRRSRTTGLCGFGETIRAGGIPDDGPGTPQMRHRPRTTDGDCHGVNQPCVQPRSVQQELPRNGRVDRAGSFKAPVPVARARKPGLDPVP